MKADKKQPIDKICIINSRLAKGRHPADEEI